MQQLLTLITSYTSLSAAAQAAAIDCFEKITIAKNEFLLTEGKVCKHLYFMEMGAVRGFYTLDGKEITHWFGFENDFITSFHSFITEQPTVENLQLLEGSVLWRISKTDLNQLLHAHHEVEKLVRIIYEKYYIRLEERFVNAQFTTAKERYEKLLHQTPQLLERVPLGYVAAYLGISQETLSRIRSRL
jgi:CRP-like cAMP-binding protein